ncbi:MAG: DUF4421 family protein [Flavobacteriales bacterium]
MKKSISICLLAVVFANLFAQEKDSVVYYTKYQDKFVVGLQQASQKFTFVFTQKNIEDTTNSSLIDYNAEANITTGLTLAWEKIAFTLNLRTTPPEFSKKKGQTEYRNLRLAIGGNKWLAETSYRRFKGFYELQSSRLQADSLYNPDEPYFLNPSMENRDIKGKFFYFTNHQKFSYKAAYNGVHRQLKTAFSPVITANVHYQMLATDSTFITPLAQLYWPVEKDIYKINFTSASVGGGLAGTMVILKKIYINALLTINMENQFRTYYEHGLNPYKLTYISFSGDFRGSIGYNSDRFYVMAYAMNDSYSIRRYRNLITSSFITGGLTFGYRFQVKERPILEKIKSSKIFNLI